MIGFIQISFFANSALAAFGGGFVAVEFCISSVNGNSVCLGGCCLRSAQRNLLWERVRVLIDAYVVIVGWLFSCALLRGRVGLFVCQVKL